MSASGRHSQLLLNAQKELQKRRLLAGVQYRPPSHETAEPDPQSWISTLCPSAAPQSQPQEPPQPKINDQEVRVSPTLAAFCLDRHNRHNGGSLDGPYRLYKIMQLLDGSGRGWLCSQDVQSALTRKMNPSFIYGKRQLKIMLRRGEGLFWQRVKSDGQVRIRLLSRARLAEALGAGRLRGREVTFPAKMLLGSGRGRQAGVNAALYAAVHAGQIQNKKGQARPITRAKVKEVSGCSNYRQRSYEKRIGISARHNIQILYRHSDYLLERARIHHHLPAYTHTDYLGKINRHQRGAQYIALRMANTYQTPQTFSVVHSQRQRTINRHLGGLCTMGSEGIDREPIVRLFHEDAAAAVSAFNRNPQTGSFWPLSGGKGTRLWRKID